MNKTEKLTKICAVICNWNKQEDVVNCVASVLKSSYPVDVVVVDNASSDNSVRVLQETFSNSITIIKNKKNLGGAGGFNTGLKYAINSNRYNSVWLLDNDVIVDELALEELYKELRKSDKNAIVGSLILRMDSPSTLQELGAFINKKTFRREANKRDFALEEIKDDVIEVDYVAACSLLVDMQKLEEVGIMDESYFLYFDDVEWCTRFGKSDYRILATPRSKIWHKEGGRNKTSNLPVYYTWRNHLHFFLQYLSKPKDIESFVKQYIDMSFTAVYSTFQLGKINAFKTLMTAIYDVLSGKRGKASKERLFPMDKLKFGRHFVTNFTGLYVIGEDLDFYTQFEVLLSELKDSSIPIVYFSSDIKKTLPEKIRDRVSVKSIQEFNNRLDGNSLLVFCRHYLSEPNSLEKTYREILEMNNENVYFLDQYSNFFKGYFAMQKEREFYLQMLDEVQKYFKHVLENKFSEIKK